MILKDKRDGSICIFPKEDYNRGIITIYSKNNIVIENMDHPHATIFSRLAINYIIEHLSPFNKAIVFKGEFEKYSNEHFSYIKLKDDVMIKYKDGEIYNFNRRFIINKKHFKKTIVNTVVFKSDNKFYDKIIACQF